MLARAVDAKHPDTRRHSERVAGLAHRLADALGWTDEARHRLREAAMVHDVGKISIPDAILLKEGRLDGSEYARVTRHAAAGAEIVAGILDAEQLDWVRHHHERLDGEGYPDRLRDAQISDGAAILAVADAWDAMTSDRPYRSGMKEEKAEAILRSGAGEKWDASVVDAFFNARDDVHEITRNWRNHLRQVLKPATGAEMGDRSSAASREAVSLPPGVVDRYVDASPVGIA